MLLRGNYIAWFGSTDAYLNYVTVMGALMLQSSDGFGLACRGNCNEQGNIFENFRHEKPAGGGLDSAIISSGTFISLRSCLKNLRSGSIDACTHGPWRVCKHAHSTAHICCQPNSPALFFFTSNACSSPQRAYINGRGHAAYSPGRHPIQESSTSTNLSKPCNKTALYP